AHELDNRRRNRPWRSPDRPLQISRHQAQAVDQRRPTNPQAQGTRGEEQRGIANVISGVSRSFASSPITPGSALGTMMEGADVPEIASTEPQHHCPNFIDSVPAEAGFESSDRSETGGGVELGRAASVKRRCRNFAPARAARFVQRRTDNSQARVLLQL